MSWKIFHNILAKTITHLQQQSKPDHVGALLSSLRPPSPGLRVCSLGVGGCLPPPGLRRLGGPDPAVLPAPQQALTQAWESPTLWQVLPTKQ